MARLASHVNAAKWLSFKRASSTTAVVSQKLPFPSALTILSTTGVRANCLAGLRQHRRFYGDESKCGSSHPTSKSSSARLLRVKDRRRVENLHGSSAISRRLETGRLVLPNEINYFTSSMENQHNYHQLAPMKNSIKSDVKDDAISIALSAVESVTPNEMIVKAIQVEDGVLKVQGVSYPLRKNVYVAAFGKAVLGMVRAVEEVLGDHLVKGVASVPCGMRETLIRNHLEHLIPGADSKVEIFEGARHNLPDQDCVNATEKICEMAGSLSHNDILLVLISGGGSSLLTLPQPPITLEDVIKVTKALGAEGATITQLNMMRRHLSRVKGGRFAQIALPAKVVSLILSDVLGDPLEAIASGPTVPCLTTAQCCLDVLSEFKLDEKYPDIKDTLSNITQYLEKKKAADSTADSTARQTLGVRFRNAYEEKMGKFSHVQNVIVGTNKMVVEEALSRAESLGYRTRCITTDLDGIARDRGGDLANMALYACSLMRRHGANEPNKKLVRLELDLVAKGLSKELSVHLSRVAAAACNSGCGLCFLSAGETTVQLSGKGGKGGRNQELALAAGIALHELSYGNVVLNNFEVMILSLGTDGQDGPTDAAGAVADVQLIGKSGFSIAEAQQFLDNNDSYNFFAQAAGGDYHIKTGLTGTNVMDLQLILIKPKEAPAFVANARARKEFDETFE